MAGLVSVVLEEIAVRGFDLGFDFLKLSVVGHRREKLRNFRVFENHGGQGEIGSTRDLHAKCFEGQA